MRPARGWSFPGLTCAQPEICETTPGVKSYAGYVTLPPGLLRNEGINELYPIHTFFYFFEARENPESAPLSLWMNGGPGTASSMTAVQHVPNGSNTWHEWTSAIAMGVPPSSQDRYNANVILAMGGGDGGGPGQHRGSGDIGGGVSPADSVPAPGAQWSMMMTYHNPNHNGG